MKVCSYFLMVVVVVLTCGSTISFAAIVQVDEDSTVAGAFDGVSSTDLINQGQSTLLSHVRSPAGLFGDNTNDGGGVANSTDAEFWSVADQPNTLTYTLDTTVNTLGYDITQIQTVSGWSTSSQSQANQDFELLVSTVGSATFTSLGSFSHTPFPDADSAGFYSARITLTDDTGVIASGVDEVRFTFAVASFGGTFPGLVIREIDVDGVTTVPEPGSFGLLIISGLIGLISIARRRRRS